VKSLLFATASLLLLASARADNKPNVILFSLMM